jgi:hypothetical protein
LERRDANEGRTPLDFARGRLWSAPTSRGPVQRCGVVVRWPEKFNEEQFEGAPGRKSARPGAFVSRFEEERMPAGMGQSECEAEAAHLAMLPV